MKLSPEEKALLEACREAHSSTRMVGMVVISAITTIVVLIWFFNRG